MQPTEPPAEKGLVRGLGAWDAALVTIGSVLGTAVFITTADVARVLPHPGLIVAVWVLGGLLTLAGALTYGELGAMFPQAGGMYVYLKEAYGPLWGFLFGWACFLIIMTGGLAALAAGFGEYLGSFVPFFSTAHVLVSVPVLRWTWTVNGGQLGGALAIAVLTVINYVGLREGAGVQNAVTVVKIGSIVGLAVFGLMVAAPVQPDLTAPLPAAATPAALGVAMIAVLWGYDGWYGATFLAGEMRRPARDLPWGLLGGTLAVTLLYVLMNLVYVRALPVEAMAATSRIGETAASVLFGPTGARLVSLAVAFSTFGCLSATILYCTRIYLAMAQDGVFFRSLARIHPRYRTPTMSIVTQGVWAIILTFSGRYDQLYTYVIFAVFLFHAGTGTAVFVLRRRRPDAPRPYRVWAYPVVPVIFILTSMAFVANTLYERPMESLLGLGMLVLGLPAYVFWRRKAA
jgi:APA family basic amino acid/polyamine antiporter